MNADLSSRNTVSRYPEFPLLFRRSCITNTPRVVLCARVCVANITAF